uniref:Cell division protein SepF n=1 Tax=Paulinella micropora TaxID=1928728 RepID=A0A385HZJ2_9EUKA|nr:hypothetical protein PMNZ_126 [Paulinella micropora]AXY63083.1 hypothetical protein PMNZ_126 [Paulinella micropora]
MYPSLLTRLRSVVAGDDYQFNPDDIFSHHSDDKYLSNSDESSTLSIHQLDHKNVIKPIPIAEDYTNQDIGGKNYDDSRQSSSFSFSPPSRSVIDYENKISRNEPHYSLNANIQENQQASKGVGLSEIAAELIIIKPSQLDDISVAIRTLQERKAIMLNLTTLDMDKAQRAVDLMAGGTFAIQGWQEQVSEKIFLFAPNSINCTLSNRSETQEKFSLGYKSKTSPSVNMTASQWFTYKVGTIESSLNSTLHRARIETTKQTLLN